MREGDAKAAHLRVLERLRVVGLLVPGEKRKRALFEKKSCCLGCKRILHFAVSRFEAILLLVDRTSINFYLTLLLLLLAAAPWWWAPATAAAAAAAPAAASL